MAQLKVNGGGQVDTIQAQGPRRVPPRKGTEDVTRDHCQYELKTPRPPACRHPISIWRGLRCRATGLGWPPQRSARRRKRLHSEQS